MRVLKLTAGITMVASVIFAVLGEYVPAFYWLTFSAYAIGLQILEKEE